MCPFYISVPKELALSTTMRTALFFTVLAAISDDTEEYPRSVSYKITQVTEKKVQEILKTYDVTSGCIYRPFGY